jgi:hypothetical protein
MAKRIVFSDDEKKLLERTASAVWEYIGYDCLQGIVDVGDAKDINSATMPKGQVIEVVLDAGRYEEELKRSKDPLVTDEFLNRWEALSYRQRQNLVRPAFPYRTYGM